MRGQDEQTSHMFSYVSPEQRVPADHPVWCEKAAEARSVLVESPK